MLVPKVNVVLQADKDIGSITEADIWLNCMDGNGNFLSVAAEDHTGDGHYIATLPLDYSPVEPFIQVHLNEMSMITCPFRISKRDRNVKSRLYSVRTGFAHRE